GRRSPTTTGGNISRSFSSRTDANAPSAWRSGARRVARRRHDDALAPAAVAGWRRALSRRRVDRRRAVAPTLRQAVVEPALLEHGIGEPDPAPHHDDEAEQQERVGDAAGPRPLPRFFLPGPLRGVPSP